MNKRCGALSWSFESGTVEDFHYDPLSSKAMVGQPEVSTQRHASGSSALKVKLQVQGDNRSVALDHDLCDGSPVAVDQRGKTLKASVFLEGPALPVSSGDHMLGLHVDTPKVSYFASMAAQPVVANTWIKLSAVLDDRAQGLFTIGINLYLNGNGTNDAWTGSLYLDDVRIE